MPDDTNKPEEEQAVVAYHYLSEENPTGGSYPGVPLRDLLAHEVEQYPKWVQEALASDDLKMFSAPGPAKPKKAAPKAKAKSKAKPASKVAPKPTPTPVLAPVVAVEKPQEDLVPPEGEESEK